MFDLNDVGDRIYLDDSEFVVFRISNNKIISNNYVIEFKKPKGIEDE